MQLLWRIEAVVQDYPLSHSATIFTSSAVLAHKGQSPLGVWKEGWGEDSPRWVFEGGVMVGVIEPSLENQPLLPTSSALIVRVLQEGLESIQSKGLGEGLHLLHHREVVIHAGYRLEAV